MGTDNLFKKRKSSKTLQRKVGNRGKPKDRILIVCEGEQTEPNYFKSFPVSSAHVEPIGVGENTLSLVKTAKKIKDLSLKGGEPFDQVWCVFDRDSHSQQNYNEAFQFAERNNIKVAYTNEAFELWYLLHFNYYTTAMSRESFQRMLDNLLNKKYKKNDREMYEKLLSKQETAIRNAERLIDYHENCNPNCNPSTTVFKLVKELNKFL